MKNKEWLKKELVRLKVEADAKNEFGSNYTDEQLAIKRVFSLIDQLDEPKAPEVVVPQWFADWIEDCPVKDKGQVVYDVWFNYENDYFTKEQDNWLQDNKELATRAILDGYTVEQPKRWVVKKGKDCVITSFNFFNEQSVNYDSNSYGKDYMYFTDRAKAEAVATLVDGSVEEI